MPLNRNILVVDDDTAVLDSYRTFLGNTPPPTRVISSRSSALASAPQPIGEIVSVEATYVTSGEDALKAIEESVKMDKPFAGAFFDVKMGGGIDGIEAIRRAQSIDPNLLYVIVTAYQDREIEEIIRILGKDFSDRWDFVSKPFSKAEILQKVNHLVSDWNRRMREKEHLHEIETQQKQLLQSERMASLGAIAKGIGHEFGNLLMAMMSTADIALLSKDPKKMEEALSGVLSAGDRAGRVVRNLQSLSKTENLREIVEIQKPIQQALQLLSFEIKKHNVKIEEVYPSASAKMSMNKVEMELVFLNLFLNAIHAMEGRPAKLGIRTEIKGRELHVEVSDTGTGIKPEHMGRLFEPLFTTKIENSSGLGLSVIKKIVTQHGGHIEATSELGKGARFLVRFPVQA